MADLIGAESCLDFGPDATATLSHGGVKPPRGKKRSNAAAKVYPPVIPSLTRATKYTVDGRLVIKEENVRRRREYLQAHRSDGRLLLNLVHVDGSAVENVEEEINEVANGPTVHSENGKCDGIGGNTYGGFAAAVAAAVAELRPPVLTGETF